MFMSRFESSSPSQLPPSAMRQSEQSDAAAEYADERQFARAGRNAKRFRRRRLLARGDVNHLRRELRPGSQVVVLGLRAVARGGDDVGNEPARPRRRAFERERLAVVGGDLTAFEMHPTSVPGGMKAQEPRGILERESRRDRDVHGVDRLVLSRDRDVEDDGLVQREMRRERADVRGDGPGR